MILRHAVLRQECAHGGIVAAFAQLVDPAGAEAKLGRHEQQVFHCGSAVDQRVVLIALVGNDDVDRRTIEIVVRAAVVRCGNGFGEF